jgi:type IV pilus assembly protein PilB
VTRIGDQLVQDGVVDRTTVETVAGHLHRHGLRLGEALVKEAGVEERDVYRALAETHGIEFSSTEQLLTLAIPDLSERVSRKFIDHERVLPVAYRDNAVLVASANPEAPAAQVAAALGVAKARLVLLTPTDWRRLRTAIDLSRLHKAELAEEKAEEAPRGDLLSGDGTSQAEMVALFNAMLLDAIGERASDIHLERYGNRVRVRIRVDGDLHDVLHYRLTPDQLTGLVNVVKVRADLDIAERRLPQGGRYSTRAGGHSFDLRVQTQPALHGEHVVIRLLPQDTKILTIEDLGLSPVVAKRYRRLLDSPQGLVLVVGPTGSGKSTTLYAGLQILAADETRKVLTVEDPIEYALENVQQSQAHPELGFGFANAMRAFVREDPDVILVGEIRDGETALEAIRASQTGHLVLSTLHCNDTVDAVQRLVDLGMHRNSIASELRAVIAQRLAKRICKSCRAPDPAPDPELLAEVFPGGNVPSGFQLFKGAGCARCGGRGTHGRIAVAELLPASADLRRAISQSMPVDDLRARAVAAGLVPLRDHALHLVGTGVITLDELPDLLPPEMLAASGPAPIEIPI